MKTAIICYASDKYMLNLAWDFIPSAVRFNPESKIIVISLGLSSTNIQTLYDANITVYNNNRQYTPQAFDLYIYDLIADVIKQEKDIDLFLKADGGDVFFQDNVFYNLPMTDGIGVVSEPIIADQGWSLARIRELPTSLQDVVLEAVRGQYMINGGVVYGYRDALIDYCESLHRIIKASNSPYFFGLDQVYINYLTYTKNFHILPRTYNFVAQCIPFYIENNLVYEQENQVLVKLVHNAGCRPIRRFVNGHNITTYQ